MSAVIRRRRLLLGAAALPWLGAVRARAAGDPESCRPVLGDDGLWHQPWFVESFLVLREDLEEAAAEGKHLVLFWELAGCPYCKETHFVNFAREDICAFAQEHFFWVQLDFIGAREVTDFDGEVTTEKALRAKYGIRFTPTIQFFPDDPAELERRLAESGGHGGRHLEVARMQGYLEPEPFLAMLRYVAEKAYERTTFDRYLLDLLG